MPPNALVELVRIIRPDLHCSRCSESDHTAHYCPTRDIEVTE